MKKVLVFLLVFFISIRSLCALQFCTPSDAYTAYMNLSEEERKNYLEPTYCKEIMSKEDSSFSAAKFFKGIFDKFKASKTDPSYNAYTAGLVTVPKNQGDLGTCWSFAAISVVETNAIKNGLPTYDLSESHLLYSILSSGYSDAEGQKGKYYVSSFDEGGNAIFASTYFFGGYGQLFESEMPYHDVETQITSSQYPVGHKTLSVGGFSYENVSEFGSCTTNEIEKVKQRIVDYGSVQAAMYYSTALFKDSGLNYYLATTNNSSVPNHAVTIVGWDDTISASNFRNATRNGAWIVKNSWGPTWSSDGFFFISYDDNFVCKSFASFYDVSDTVFENTYNAADVMGSPAFYFDETLYTSAKFEKKTDGPESLERVSFPVGEYQTYYVYLVKNNDLTDQSTWQLLGGGTSDTYGMRSIDLSNTALSDDFTIVVKYIVADGEYSAIFTMCSNIIENTQMDYSSETNYYSGYGSIWNDFSSITIGDNNYSCEPNIYAYTNSMPQTMNITLSASFDDNNNQDGKRPERVRVFLYSDYDEAGTDELYNSYLLREDENFELVVEDLPKYNGEREVNYSMLAQDVTDYNKNVTGFSVAYSHEPETIDLTIKAEWEDGNNEDLLRPDTIDVTLKANGNDYDVYTLDKDDNYTYNVTVDKYADGLVVEYTISGPVINGYSTEIEALTITYTHIPGTIDITVSASFDDNYNQDGIRPSSVSVTVYANQDEVGTYTLNSSNNWSHTITSVPEKDNGETITYTVVGNPVNGYTANSSGYNVVFSHTPETVDIHIETVWNDNNNAEGKRPDTINATLFRNNTFYQYVALPSSSNYSADIAMPKYQDGVLIQYRIEGQTVPRYDLSITGFTLVYTYREEEPTITIDSIINVNDVITLQLSLQDINPNDITYKITRASGQVVTSSFTITPNYSNNKITVKSNGKVSGTFTITVSAGEATASRTFTLVESIKSKNTSFIKIDGYNIFVTIPYNYTFNYKDLMNNLTISNSYVTVKDKSNTTQTSNTATIQTGSRIILNNSTYNIIVIGDVNEDGKISALDYIVIRNHIMGTKITNSSMLLAADMDKSSTINALDYIAIRKIIMGMS